MTGFLNVTEAQGIKTQCLIQCDKRLKDGWIDKPFSFTFPFPISGLSEVFHSGAPKVHVVFGSKCLIKKAN